MRLSRQTLLALAKIMLANNANPAEWEYCITARKWVDCEQYLERRETKRQLADDTLADDMLDLPGAAGSKERIEALRAFYGQFGMRAQKSTNELPTPILSDCDLADRLASVIRRSMRNTSANLRPLGN